MQELLELVRTQTICAHLCNCARALKFYVCTHWRGVGDRNPHTFHAVVFAR